MDLEITVSMTAAKTVETLTPILEAAKAAVESGGHFDETFYGKSESNADMIVHFDNDDMEREEMADVVLVTVDQQ
jgi:hypothetical protein